MVADSWIARIIAAELAEQAASYELLATAALVHTFFFDMTINVINQKVSFASLAGWNGGLALGRVQRVCCLEAFLARAVVPARAES